MLPFCRGSVCNTNFGNDIFYIAVNYAIAFHYLFFNTRVGVVCLAILLWSSTVEWGLDVLTVAYATSKSISRQRTGSQIFTQVVKVTWWWHSRKSWKDLRDSCKIADSCMYVFLALFSSSGQHSLYALFGVEGDEKYGFEWKIFF